MKKQTFIFSHHRNFLTGFSDIYHCFSLLQHLFYTEILFGIKTRGNQKSLYLDSKDNVTSVTNQTSWWFPLFLLQYEALHCPGERWLQKIEGVFICSSFLFFTCLRSWQYEALFTVASFSRKSIVMHPFISQVTVSLTFFIDHSAWNFFFIRGESVHLPSMNCLFDSGS